MSMVNTNFRIKMAGQLLLLLALFLTIAWPASADTYTVTVATGSITGTSGSLDFQFNPGPFSTQLANLQILDFTSDGTLAGAPSPFLTGDVSGTLPGTVTFDNLGGLNDYFTDFTFGSTLSFEVSLFGPAVTSPDGISTSGSAFAFSMFSDAAGTIPVLTSDTVNGFAATVDVNLDGTTMVNNSSSATTVSPVVSAPEPSSILQMELGLAGLLLMGAFRRRLFALT